MMMPARVVVASGIKVLRAGHLKLMSVNKLMMRLVMRLMMQRRRAATHRRRLMRMQFLGNGAGTILLGVDDDASVAGRRGLQMMMMRMLHCSIAIAMVSLWMTLLVAVVMLKRRGVIALIVVETAVRVHDDAASLVQRCRRRRVRRHVMVMMRCVISRRQQAQRIRQMHVQTVGATAGTRRRRVRPLLLTALGTVLLLLLEGRQSSRTLMQ